MPLRRLLALSATALLLAGCTQEDNLKNLLDQTLSAQGEVTITTSCTSFLGLGPSVAIFEVSPKLAEEAMGLTGRFSDNPAWSVHKSMPDFHKDRSRAFVGIGATLLDGKECLRSLTEKANTILFETMPGTYYASANEEVNIVLFAEPRGTGVIFVQAP